MYIKYTTVKGKTEFNMRPRNDGMIIKPDSSEDDETIITNCKFECGNSKLKFNLALKDFGSTSDGYIGVVFRYLKVGSEEEY